METQFEQPIRMFLDGKDDNMTDNSIRKKPTADSSINVVTSQSFPKVFASVSLSIIICFEI
jgi:hypothetical protein